MADDVDVMVVGAGPVGLFMAGELIRHGARVRVIDGASGPTQLSKAIAVHARTMEIFQDIGIADTALAQGLRMHGASVYSDGKRVAHLVMDELDSPYPFILSLEQSHTERILIDHLARLGGTVERQTTMTGFAQDDDGVTVSFTRPDGAEAAQRARWLVGCDGAHSTTRHTLGLEFEGDAMPQNMLLADVQLDWDHPDDELTASLSDAGILFVAPLASGRARVIAEVGDDVTEVSLDDVQHVLDTRIDGAATVSDPAWLTTFRISERQVERYCEGRVFLAGDAAHIHSPAGGQGMNTGIQDAYNLAWKLGLAARGKASDALIASYDDERHPVGRAVLRGTGIATRVITLRNPLARHLRDRFARLMTGMEVVQERMRTEASQLGVGYRDSAIVGEFRGPGPGARAFNHGPAPGERAPDGMLKDPQDGAELTLFELTRGPTHDLLFFAGIEPGDGDEAQRGAVVRAVLAAIGGDARAILISAGTVDPHGIWDGIRVSDADGDLHRRYGAEHACLYVVRPDGYVGFRSLPPDADAVMDYFRRITAIA
jgi:2-polyprenyl-6-methoxyphenol hydroxylase-like FAD-dependent oxidoreductase